MPFRQKHNLNSASKAEKSLSNMAKQKQQPTDDAVEEIKRDELVLTADEFAKLSESEREQFRAKNGTISN